ncbi:uncharacterized protein [Montipora capricornis]|uniref:uncharacterized protein n=1 Tax=Montipora capricornis TaxID=246305 RepID=UPI0035F208FC
MYDHEMCILKKMADKSKFSMEEVDLEVEGELAQVNGHIKEVFEILKRETLRVRTEKEAFETVAKKLEHVHFSKTLKLNIGGQFFTTSLETMKKDPGSMLHAMFSGRFDTKPSEDGSYFIDRDGTHFRYILNYLRSGKLVVPEDKIVRKELLNEAEFYQIQGIVDVLKCQPFQESTILSTEHRQTLIGWLKSTLASASHDYVLIYRASRDGWAAANFHKCCDRKGPTVIVGKNGNNIFGGYTEVQWESLSIGIYKKDPNSFLFSLVNPSGLNFTKMSLIPEKMNHAIYCSSSHGPIFGAGHDLRITNNPHSNSCYSKLSNSYQVPPGQKATTFLTGSENFVLSEMEVFGFEM